VTVSSIRLNNVPIQCATAGQTVTFKVSSPLALTQGGDSVATATTGGAKESTLITPLKKALSRGSLQPSPSGSAASSSVFSRRSTASGLVLLSAPSIQAAAPRAYTQFDCELIILNHPNKIRVNYEPIVHIGCVKQAARIMSIRKISGSKCVFSCRVIVIVQYDMCDYQYLYLSHRITEGVTPSATGSKSGLEAIALQRTSSDDTLNTVCNGEKAIVRWADFDPIPSCIELRFINIFVHVIWIGLSSCTTPSI
jgi:hypothetical protein